MLLSEIGLSTERCLAICHPMASCLQLKLWLYDIFKWVSEAEIFFSSRSTPILHLHFTFTFTYYTYILYLHFPTLAHLNSKPDFTDYIYREVPVYFFNFRGECQFGYCCNMCYGSQSLFMFQILLYYKVLLFPLYWIFFVYFYIFVFVYRSLFSLLWGNVPGNAFGC